MTRVPTRKTASARKMAPAGRKVKAAGASVVPKAKGLEVRNAKVDSADLEVGANSRPVGWDQGGNRPKICAVCKIGEKLRDLAGSSAAAAAMTSRACKRNSKGCRRRRK